MLSTQNWEILLCIPNVSELFVQLLKFTISTYMIPIQMVSYWGPPLALWFRPHLRTCSPGFGSWVNHLRSFHNLIDATVCHWLLKSTNKMHIREREVVVGPELKNANYTWIKSSSQLSNRLLTQCDHMLESKVAQFPPPQKLLKSSHSTFWLKERFFKVA